MANFRTTLVQWSCDSESNSSQAVLDVFNRLPIFAEEVQ